MATEAERKIAPFKRQEGLLLIGGFISVSAVVILFVFLLGAFKTATMIALPMLSIASIALLLICLAAISYVFVRVGLQDRGQALGLPSGSIQSVIALSLIVLFAFLSILIFTAMGDVAPRTLKGLTGPERDDQVTRLGANFAGWEPQGEGKYTIYVRDPGLDARNDIGKQLLVLIGTLMTSAVSFYFGTRATVAGADAGARKPDGGQGDGDGGGGDDPPAAPTITAIEPSSIPREKTTEVAITGTGLAASSVSFAADGKELPLGGWKATPTGLTCTLTPPADAAAGAYDVTVVVADKDVVKAGGLTVT